MIPHLKSIGTKKISRTSHASVTPIIWYKIATSTSDPKADILSGVKAVIIEEKISAGRATFWL